MTMLPVDGREATAATMPWLDAARRMMDGDIAPLRSRRDMLIWGLQALSASVPVNVAWCGLVVGTALARGGVGDRRPLLEARARPWLDFGAECSPQSGAVMVFWTLHPRSPFGHVGFCVGEDDTAYHILGGNQYDAIGIARWPKARLIGCRWPCHATAPAGLVQRRRRAEAMPFQFEAWERRWAALRNAVVPRTPTRH